MTVSSLPEKLLLSEGVVVNAVSLDVHVSKNCPIEVCFSISDFRVEDAVYVFAPDPYEIDQLEKLGKALVKACQIARDAAE